MVGGGIDGWRSYAPERWNCVLWISSNDWFLFHNIPWNWYKTCAISLLFFSGDFRVPVVWLANIFHKVNSHSCIKSNGETLFIEPDVILKLISSPSRFSGDQTAWPCLYKIFWDQFWTYKFHLVVPHFYDSRSQDKCTVRLVLFLVIYLISSNEICDLTVQ